MVSVAASGEPGSTGGGGPRGSFHVAPPPPARPATWKSELAIALGLALLFNLLVILSFLALAPEAPPRQEPPSITVELVQEPKPQPEPQAPVSSPFDFGPDNVNGKLGDTDRPAKGASDESEQQPEEPPVPEALPEEEARAEDVPEWARTIQPSYSAPRKGGKEVGSGDAYGRMLRARLNANLVLPRNLDLAGTIPPQANVAIDRAGKLVGLALVRSSGNAAYDRAMLDAIVRAFPMPPLPDHIQGDTVTLPLVLNVN